MEISPVEFAAAVDVAVAALPKRDDILSESSNGSWPDEEKPVVGGNWDLDEGGKARRLLIVFPIRTHRGIKHTIQAQKMKLSVVWQASVPGKALNNSSVKGKAASVIYGYCC